MARPVSKLVKAGAVVVDLLDDRGLRRNRDVVAARHVAGARAADAKIGTGRGDQRLATWDDLALGPRGGCGVDVRRQAVALRDVEHGEALEERHGLGLVAG